MAGKRTRQIQRTTSMTQLGGGGVMFSEGINGVAGLPFRGHSCPFNQESGHTSMEPFPEVWEMLPPAMEEQANNMAIDSMAEKDLSAFHTPCSGAGTIISPHEAPVLGSEALTFSEVHQFSHSAHLGSIDRAATYLRHGRSNGGGSGRPAYFLDICYLCSKLLGHGRDVFIYRGDKAFCSAECRHMQIVADERREKGARTVAKKGPVMNGQVSDASNAGSVETVAAA